eukprot:TRINITY_DN868_c0_g1_i1.p1 TRINITY_DN868_c0_g1~~TRINITY_DN868_c0_g1_i1.p1  ORF type:complete len:165 (-),score=48.38 TRINITY_DN868_c0_g1_i1:57-551(-)
MASSKVENCAFSGLKIYPGHGMRFVRSDAKTFIFLNGKCQASFLMKRNPRRINWTLFYRRLHKKGQTEEVQKRKTRRTAKAQRAIVGASMEEIRAKRNQPEHVRQAAREQALRAVKEANQAKQAAKKAAAEKKVDKKGGKAQAASKAAPAKQAKPASTKKQPGR